MTFNLFGPPTKDDIRVGYIDPDRGLVEGVTICQANEYAIKNPGTTFVFRNGNNIIQYLNINEVNNIDPNILNSTDQCGGINQRKECGPPTIQFFGGGGIGAAGNPVVGRDGALLAVDVVRGGNGYQYPPIVAARDNCNYGSGATLTAVLGEVVETIETYENESDFEDYELCKPTDVGYGKRYGPNGEDLGDWEPRLYTDPGEDPIRNQVEEFEKIVRRLARAPFWTTRKNKPTKITCSDPRVIPSKYDVTDKTHLDYRRSIGEKNPVGWNEFMNTYAISPVSPSNVRGSDFAGRVFTFEWTEDFPTDGEYIFRGLCDNTAQLFVDNEQIANLGIFNGPVRPIQKTFRKGLHNIRVDLINAIPAQQSSTETQPVGAYFHLKGRGYYLKVGGNDKVQLSFKLDWSGTGDPSKTAITKIIIPTEEGSPVVLTRSKSGNVFTTTGSASGSGIFQANKDYGPIIFEGATGRVPPKIINVGDVNVNPSAFQQAIEFQDSNDSNPDVDARLDIVGNSGVQLSGARRTEPAGTVISPRSWNENPMGVALTIDAPEPPIPQELKPEQEGRCPPNPIWTTRFPGAKEQWYPVQFNGSKSPQGKQNPWGKFFNRYGISPVPPLDTPGSDGGGVLFTNTWELEIPYDGFYQFGVMRDNTARLYVDGNLAFDIGTSGDRRWKDVGEKPKFQKVFITKGRHTIGVELENTKSEFFEQVSQRIFRTKDWQVAAVKSTQKVDVDFTIRGVASSAFASSFKVSELNVNVSKPSRTAVNQTVSAKAEVGKVYVVEIEVPQSKGITLQVKGNTLEVEDLRSSTARDLFCTISKGRFFDIQNGARKATCKFVVDEPGAGASLEGLSGGTSKDGVTYEGPPLFAYKDNRWGTFMNNHSVSPVVPGNLASERMRSTWRGVKFPESGQYDITFLSDSGGILFIGGKEVLRAQGFAENPQTFKVNISQGTYDVVVDNDYPYFSQGPNTIEYFRDINPTGFALVIRKNVSVRRDYGKSWDENPMGIGAILIPPPCPRRIRGRGVVTDVIVNDPGNGYLRPIPQDQGYPVALRLKEVIVENPGINYNCGVDELIITPSNGAELDYICDPFGKIREVKVLNPGLGFTEYPEIRLISETGVNATFRPVFEVVRDPIVLPERLIQVTDLVGLKQTGYVDGRAYYGAVYYDQGVRFAGFYETVGEPVRVYDTLQESITAQVTTPASAIQRQGTDVTSNDPRLNIPGTPQNLN
jgi:hypothetical protein